MWVSGRGLNVDKIVSIIIPVYNAEKTINRCVESVLNQSYGEIEIILVDDGSIDSSLQLCKTFEYRDSRIIIVEKENGGVSSARNLGMHYATGEYIMFLDSDDWYEENMVEQYMTLMESHGSDVVIGSLKGINLESQASFIKNVPVVGKYKEDIWNVICASSEMFGYIGGKMFKRSILNKYVIRFNEKMYAQEDLDFCLSYYEVADRLYLTEYAGYCYYYAQGKRKPPYCDFMRNQLKLLNIAKKKCELNPDSFKKIQDRICGYVYVMLYEAGDKENIYEACRKMKEVDTLDDYLASCTFEGEKKYIISWYLNGKQEWIYRYFKIRNFIKRIVGKKQ